MYLLCMGLQKKLKNITRFRMIRCEDGIKKGKLKRQEQRKITEGITSQKIMKKVLYMQGSHHLSNLKISKEKSNISQKDTQTIQSSQTLDQELILKEKDSRKSWTKFLKEKSKKLWLPQETDCLDLDSNFMKRFSENLGHRSLHSNQKNSDLPNKNSQKTCYRLSQFSQQDITEPESTNNMITRKIRIYPNTKQKLFFNKCFGVSRYIYNKTVKFVKEQNTSDYDRDVNDSIDGCIFNKCHKEICKDTAFFCKKHKTKKRSTLKINLPNLRKNVMNEKKDWLEEIPYDTRQLIIKDYCSAYKSAISNYKNGNIKQFDMRYKSKKNPSQIFHIDKRALKCDLNLFKRRKIGKL